MAQPTLTVYCSWFAILMFGSEAVHAAPPTVEPLDRLSVLDPFVGSWVFQLDKKESFSARQECRWILNKQFLTIDTQVIRPGQAPISWRTLITYDKTCGCYRQWKFSDNGTVSTAKGTWNENSSILKLSGRTANGHIEELRLEMIDDNTIILNVREFLDDKQTRADVIGLMLRRLPLVEGRKPTK